MSSALSPYAALMSPTRPRGPFSVVLAMLGLLLRFRSRAFLSLSPWLTSALSVLLLNQPRAVRARRGKLWWTPPALERRAGLGFARASRTARGCRCTRSQGHRRGLR